MPGEKQITIYIHRPYDTVLKNVYAGVPGQGYRLAHSEEENQEVNLAKLLGYDFVAVVTRGERDVATLYSEDEMHEYLATEFDVQQRPSWMDYFLMLARDVATRSTCLRRKVGAVAVDPNTKRILATGYNGAPRRARHCLLVGCLREQLNIPSGQREELCRAVHAEANVVAQAAMHGVSLAGAHLYCTHRPCVSCTKLLINAGVAKVIFVHDYPWQEDMKALLDEGLIEFEAYAPSKEEKGGAQDA